MDQSGVTEPSGKNVYQNRILKKLAECGLSREQALSVADYISERLAFLGHAFSEDSSIFSFNDKIKNTALLLHISYEDYLQAALTQPPLFMLAPETVNDNVTTLARLLGVGKKALIKPLMKQPALLYQSPERINENAKISARLLAISKEAFVTAGLKQPTVLSLLPERINGNIESAALLLGISKDDYLTAALKKPTLFTRVPTKINDNMETGARLLGIAKADYVRAALQQPSIFSQLPTTINNNIETGARLLGLAKEEYLALALKIPTLFYRSPEKINQNVETAAQMLGLSKEDVLMKVIPRQASLLTQSPETLASHARMIRRFEAKRLIPVSADELMMRSPGLLTLSDDNFHLRRAYAVVADLQKPQNIKLLKDSRGRIERAFVAALGHDPDVTVITAVKPWKEDVQTEEDRNLRTLIANIENGLLSGYRHAPELAPDDEDDISWEEAERILFGEPELEV